MGEMVIHSTLVQSLQVNADVLANTTIDTDPDEMARLPSPSVDVGNAADRWSNRRIVHDTDEAHAQTSSLAIPLNCYTNQP
jgi:hypothetical protein